MDINDLANIIKNLETTVVKEITAVKQEVASVKQEVASVKQEVASVSARLDNEVLERKKQQSELRKNMEINSQNLMKKLNSYQ